MAILQHCRHFATLIRPNGFVKRTLLSPGTKAGVVTPLKAKIMTFATKSEVSLQTFPQKASLVDEIVAIEVTGLRPKQPITLRSYFNDEDKQFESYAHYTSDANGRINTTRHPSEGGRFSGTEPMGLFWSMVACPRVRYGTRYVKRDVTKPFVVDISAHDSHLTDSEVRSDSLPLATTSIERWYMSEYVERIPVDGQKFQYTLFKPKGPGPFPAVIDIFGGLPSGCNEFRGALLASKGYAALCLGYFWTKKGIPRTLLDMEHFEEAVDWLSSQPFVQPGGVGTIGSSKGGEMAAAMAIHFPDKVQPGGVGTIGSSKGGEMAAAMAIHFPHKIRATVCIATSGIFIRCPTTYKGKLFPYLYYKPYETTNSNDISLNEDGHVCLKNLFKDTQYDLFQKFEKIKCPTLIMHGESDDMVPSHHGKRIAELIQTNGHDNPCEFVSFPGAGHVLEPPYTPSGTYAYHPPWAVLSFGGNQRDNAYACESSWKKLLDFLHEYMKEN